MASRASRLTGDVGADVGPSGWGVHPVAVTVVAARTAGAAADCFAVDA